MNLTSSESSLLHGDGGVDGGGGGDGSSFATSTPASAHAAASPSEAAGDVGTPGRPSRERSMFHDLMRRRMSYDIDNIVIPYRFTEFYWVLPSFNLVLT